MCVSQHENEWRLKGKYGEHLPCSLVWKSYLDDGVVLYEFIVVIGIDSKITGHELVCKMLQSSRRV